MILMFFVVGMMNSIIANDNESKPTIAVALPNIDNIDVTREVVAKLIQIELIKLDVYSVYDEFDIQEAMDSDMRFTNDCYGKNCLIDLGRTVDVDYIVSTSLLRFGGKIVISFKFIEIATGQIVKNDVKEFVDDKREIQRMLEVVIRQMHDEPVHKELLSRITYDKQPIIKSEVGKINNSGPRMGYAFLSGDLREFAERPANQGGLSIFPGMSMIGYQLEKQYIGTENFSALGEVLITISGLEQGVFVPSITFMNGLRFGKAGWELAFGPGFGIKQMSRGFYDTKGLYGPENFYWSEEAFRNKYGSVVDPVELPYEISENLDERGSIYKLNTRWVMAFGRTFRVGGLNVPVNIFYSSMRNSGMFGVSVGFNVVQN